MSKYRNVRTEVDGIVFDSKKEAGRWRELCLLQRAGEIKELQRQIPFSIDIHGEHICKYIADFFYQEKLPTKAEVWKTVIEDCKGYRTEVYKLKKKLVAAVYGYYIRET